MGYLIVGIIGGVLICYFIGKAGKKTDKSEPHTFLRISTSTSCENDHEPRSRYEPPSVYSYWDEIKRVSVKARLELLYTDSHDETNRRIVRVSSYDGSPYLEGFCELRNAYRTFRIDRIKEAVDTETGETIESVPAFLEEKYHQSSEYILSVIFSDHLDVLKVLFYIGKADGQLKVQERNIIYTVIRNFAKDHDLTDKEIERKMKTLTVPSPQAFKLAFDRICKKSPRLGEKVLAVSEKIIQTDKTIHLAEEESLGYMARRIKRIAQ